MQHDDLEESSSTAVEPPDLEPVEIDPSGRYIRYDEVLGRGSYKTVYKAFDDADGIEVAWSRIKIDALLHSAGDLERVHSEVQILKYLKHDNIMKFCSSWIDERKRTVNIITELFSSGSLKKYRMKHKTVDIRVIKRWARQILVAVDYLHSHQPPIIHRDLKCDNIFINGNRGEIKLGDLGFATVRRKPNCRSVIGTPEFMAPELYQEEYNELIDIYSFGMCMLELLTFDYPYSECDSTFKIYQKVLRGEKPDAFYKIRDPEVTAFIEKCIAPADRRSSAKDLLMDPFLYTEVLQHPHLEHSDQEGYDHHHLSSETFLQHPHIGSFVGEHFDHDSEPEVISILHDDADGSPIHIVVQKSLYNRAFLLTGERREGKSVLSLWLRIDSDRGLEVEMRVLFYLDNEFPPVTSDIVDRFGLDGEDGKYLSSLVDILLVHMFPVWNPNFDSPIKADETGSCSSRHSTDFSSVTSLRYLFELEEEAGYFTDEWEEDEKVPPVQADDLVLHAMSMFCISPADDDVSIISTDARGDKSMAAVMPPDKSCVVTTDDDDDEVRTELDMIDHQYREALSQIISRREKAIEMVRSKAALRKGSFS